MEYLVFMLILSTLILFLVCYYLKLCINDLEHKINFLNSRIDYVFSEDIFDEDFINEED